MNPTPDVLDLLHDWEDRVARGDAVTVEELCHDRPDLLDEVRRCISLLQFVSPLLDLGESSPYDDVPTLDGYEILDRIGAGGMGVVYRGRDTTLGRIVAVKLPRAGPLTTKLARRRFVREARVLAKLRHPNIVSVHVADLADDQPYFVMDYLPRGSLADHAGKVAGNVDRVCAMMEQVARAVGHAHERSILHRDLKPSNILLDERDRPLVCDFGLAALLDAEEDSGISAEAGQYPDTSAVTRPGYPLGTPRYRAPEQATGSTGEVGPPADVYALGVILSELLHGTTGAKVSRDLKAVCRKCLAEDPRQRYANAVEFADELEALRQGRPIRARQRSRVERAWKWARARPALASLVAAAVLILPSLAVGWIGYMKFHQVEQAKLERRVEAAWAARGKGVDLCTRGDGSLGMLWLAHALATAPASAADLQELIRLDLGAWRSQFPTMTASLPHPDKVWDVRFSPDGRLVVTLCTDNHARLWETDTGRLLDPPLAHPFRPLKARFSDDGRTVRTICVDGQIRTWSIDDRKLIRTEAARSQPKISTRASRKWNADLAWELELGAPPARPIQADSEIWKVEMSRDRQKALTLDFKTHARLWNVPEAKRIGEKLPHEGILWDGAIDPLGRYAATAGEDKRVRFWKLDGGAEQHPALSLESPVHAVAFSPDGTLLATGDVGTLRIWDVATRKNVTTVLRQSTVRSLAFSPDGQRLASGNGETEVRLWKLPARPQPPLVHPLAEAPDGAVADGARRMPLGYFGIHAVAYHPSGKYLLSAGVDDAVRVWDPETRRSVRVLLRQPDTIQRLAVHPAGRLVLTGGMDKTTRIVEFETGQEVLDPRVSSWWVGAVAFSHEGTLAATGAHAKEHLRVLGCPAGQAVAEFGPFNGVFDLAFSPDGRHVLAGSSNAAYWCDVRANTYLPVPHVSTVFAVAVEPNGNTFVTGNEEGELRWWDPTTLACQACVPAHLDRIQKAAFTPGGEILATLGWDQKLLYWHTRTRQPVGHPVQFPSAGQSIAIRPDGQVAMIGCKNGQIHAASMPRALRGSPGQIVLWAQVATGMELDPGESPLPLTPDAWRERRLELDTEKGSL